jgi:hypothetical protein
MGRKPAVFGFLLALNYFVVNVSIPVEPLPNFKL